MNNDNINDYVPSLLNPRSVRKAADLSLTQNSILSRCSLSLKRRNGPSITQKNLNNVTPLNKQESVAKNDGVLQHLQNNTNNIGIEKKLISATEEKSIILLTKKEKKSSKIPNKNNGKENIQNCPKLTPNESAPKYSWNKATIDDLSIGLSAIEDINTIKNNDNLSSFSFGGIEIPTKNLDNCNSSAITVSSATDLVTGPLNDSSSTIQYDHIEVPVISISFGMQDCEKVDLSTKNTSIKKVLVTHKENITNIDCELFQNSHISLSDSGSRSDASMNKVKQSQSPQKRSAVAVNLEIKKKRLSQDANEVNEDSKVLILNTDDIAKLTHVIVQPPNYKLVKKQILRNNKYTNNKRKSYVSDGGHVRVGDGLKQKRIDCYFRKSVDVVDGTLLSGVKGSSENKNNDVGWEGGAVMSKNLGAVDSQGGRCAAPCGSPHAGAKQRARDGQSSRAALRTSQTDARRAASAKHDSGSSHSPRRQADSLHFSLTTKTKSVKSTSSPRNIPHYKIVAGTHFAVDAFSYGDIPNVKHYFLTHFHSDHYAGLKKSFNKFLFCSKITAELCMTRLGVNSKNIHIIDNDDTFTIDGIQVTAVDANHCPGAIMLVFSLPNGKTLLHTGDFRAAPAMESYPVFWNKDIHTIYLDTTYCNPRYDFPTQDQSLEMALYVLRQKKMLLEKSGKKFSSVLIVCGTYTIGKEKFFLGMARRVGCSVWACPEKDRVLRAVEGRSFSHAPAHSCQLHVVPMRDLTHEKLRTYLDSLNGAFSEVVAFKPSGWENGKNSIVEKDGVTIHGIPYSEHSSFSELIRFVKFLKPRQVVPTVDISGGAKAVQKYFPCPIVWQEELMQQTKLTDCFSIQSRPQGSAAVT